MFLCFYGTSLRGHLKKVAYRVLLFGVQPLHPREGYEIRLPLGRKTLEKYHPSSRDIMIHAGLMDGANLRAFHHRVKYLRCKNLVAESRHFACQNGKAHRRSGDLRYLSCTGLSYCCSCAFSIHRRRRRVGCFWGAGLGALDGAT